MSGVFRLVACLLVILLSGTPVFSQIPAEFIPPPLASTVAALPVSCDQGEVRRLSDGDMEGAIVQCNDSNTWYCLDYYSDMTFNVGCPPWKADHTDADSAAAFQAMFDEVNATQPDPTKSRPTMLTPGDYVYQIKTPLTFVSPGTTALFHLRSEGQGGLTFDFLDAVNPGLSVTCAGGVCNVIRIDNLFLTGGASFNAPDVLLYLGSAAQIYLDGVIMGGGRKIAIETDICVHFEWTSGICAGGASGVTDSACVFFSNTCADIRINGIGIEFTPGTTHSFVRFGPNEYRQVNISDNNSSGDELYRFVTMDAGTGHITDGIIANNTVKRLGDAGIVLNSTNSGAGLNTVSILNNKFHGLAADASTGDCIRVSKPTDSIIADNVCSDFNNGIATQNVVSNLQIRGNSIENAEFDGIVNEASFAQTIENMTIKDNIISAQSNAIQSNNANLTSNGQNSISGTILADAGTRALATVFNLDEGFAHNTDSVQLADQKQIVTCDTTGDASVATKAAKPHYLNIGIDNNDDDGGCDFTLTTTDAHEGMRVRVSVLETAGGTVRVVAASTDTITTSDVFIYQFQNGAWRKIN